MYTGKNTLWFRFYNCNLQCSGFGQEDPTNPSTYELPYKDFDTSTVTKLEDLPVWKFGCDSSYSWAKKFKHLNHNEPVDVIAGRLQALLMSDENPNGSFLHDKSGIETHMCFTGGEPLLAENQLSVIRILSELGKRPGGTIPKTSHRKQNFPRYVTFETNGTQQITEEFNNYLVMNSPYIKYMFSVSPKLYTVSGEKNAKAIKPDVVRGYQKITNKGQLKFVMGIEDRQWEELDRVIDQFRNGGVDYPVYIMPVGAREEEQYNIAAEVSDRALAKGFHVSARLHTYVYGNKIGT